MAGGHKVQLKNVPYILPRGGSLALLEDTFRAHISFCVDCSQKCIRQVLNGARHGIFSPPLS